MLACLIFLRKLIIVTTRVKNRNSSDKIVQTTARTEQYLAYLNNVIGVFDKNEAEQFYHVMYNALIHNPATVRSFIEKRGYRCIYLAPYSSFLNPIELFQLKIKYGVKRQPFESGDTITLRMMESCSKIIKKNCQRWTCHSVNFFERCLAIEQSL